jgi:hypothetical protein
MIQLRTKNLLEKGGKIKFGIFWDFFYFLVSYREFLVPLHQKPTKIKRND